MFLPLPPPAANRIAFLGTPEIAVPTLDALVDAGFVVPIVVTGPDRRRGRGGATSPSAVKAAAQRLGLPVTTEITDVVGSDAELGVVVAFGELIPTHVLERVPMVNLHVSALPRWRGAAPIERAILAGDGTTAVSIISVAEALDEGDIWAQQTVEIGDSETAASLRRRLGELGGQLMVDTIRTGFPASVPQQGDPVYAKKIGVDDIRLNWARPADELHRVIRVGGAWTTFRGERFKIWEAQLVADGPNAGVIEGTIVGAGIGGLDLVTVQPAGKRRMSAVDWINGTNPTSSDRFGEPDD